jgi:hypothetical protein
LRLTRLVRQALGTRWDAATWPIAKAQLRRALELRREVARAGWFN